MNLLRTNIFHVVMVTVLQRNHTYTSRIYADPPAGTSYSPSRQTLSCGADMFMSYKYGMNSNWLITSIPS
jgi:hypothetical protein